MSTFVGKICYVPSHLFVVSPWWVPWFTRQSEITTLIPTTKSWQMHKHSMHSGTAFVRQRSLHDNVSSVYCLVCTSMCSYFAAAFNFPALLCAVGLQRGKYAKNPLIIVVEQSVARKNHQSENRRKYSKRRCLADVCKSTWWAEMHMKQRGWQMWSRPGNARICHNLLLLRGPGTWANDKNAWKPSWPATHCHGVSRGILKVRPT